MTRAELVKSLELWQRRHTSRHEKYQAAKKEYERLSKKFVSTNTQVIAAKKDLDKYTKLHRESLAMMKTRTAEIKKIDNQLPNHISEAGIKFIQEFEGWYSHPYDDGVGVKTIGWGFIASDFPNGKVPNSMTRAQGDKMFVELLNKKYEPVVRRLVKYLHDTKGINLNQHQYDALVSFVFNLGVGILDTSHTVGQLLHAGQLHKAADSFLQYSNPNDPNVHAGLLRRRKGERAMFLK